jgi:hypothetical protein
MAGSGSAAMWGVLTAVKIEPALHLGLGNRPAFFFLQNLIWDLVCMSHSRSYNPYHAQRRQIIKMQIELEFKPEKQQI